jgi:hypothetical protein
MYQASRPPLERIMKIDQSLRASDWPNCRTLAEGLEVDPRTVRRDIDFMQNRLKAPIDYDSAPRLFRYAESTGPIGSLPSQIPSYLHRPARGIPPSTVNQPNEYESELSLAPVANLRNRVIGPRLCEVGDSSPLRGDA